MVNSISSISAILIYLNQFIEYLLRKTNEIFLS
jgi:hypothetical protein